MSIFQSGGENATKSDPKKEKKNNQRKKKNNNDNNNHQTQTTIRRFTDTHFTIMPFWNVITNSEGH